MFVTKQTTPHTQSQQNANPAQTDLEPGQQQQDAGRGPDGEMYQNMEGSETGGTRSAKKSPDLPAQHNTEPAEAAHEGSVSTRTPRTAAQGITAHSSEQESERQKKVVNDRPDAQAGVNHSEKKRAS
jgi:hypothetical protein